MAILTYLAAHWMLASGVTLAVVGLGTAAWFLKSPKIALMAVALAVAGFMYQGAVTHGIELQLRKEMAEQLETLKDRAKTIAILGEFNTKRALEDAIKNEELEKLASDTPANNRACLDIDSARRLRNIR